MKSTARSSHTTIRAILPAMLLLLVAIAQVARAQVTYDFVYDPDANSITLNIGGSWTSGSFINEDLGPETYAGGAFIIADQSYAFWARAYPNTGGSYSTYSTPTVALPTDMNWTIGGVLSTLDTPGSSYTGDIVGFYIASAGSMSVHAPINYITGSTLSGTAIFNSVTFDNLGLSDGDGGTILLFGGNSVVWTASIVSSSPGPAVPEPSTYAAILGVVALGFVAWRRRRPAAG